MVRFPIYFSDLNEEAQKALLETVHADSPRVDMNWDGDLLLAILNFEEE